MDKIDDDGLDDLKPVGDLKVSTSHGIAAIALSLAMRFHQINTVQDGVLYQQYKLEGKNMVPLHLDLVFETAVKIEQHLLASSDRIAALVINAIATNIEDEVSNEPKV